MTRKGLSLLGISERAEVSMVENNYRCYAYTHVSTLFLCLSPRLNLNKSDRTEQTLRMARMGEFVIERVGVGNWVWVEEDFVVGYDETDKRNEV